MKMFSEARFVVFYFQPTKVTKNKRSRSEVNCDQHNVRGAPLPPQAN